jgi:hypothetical protein
MPRNDHERLVSYVERFFARHKKETWPTVRQATHALGWTQTRLQDAVDGDPEGRLYTTSYFTVIEDPFGDHFVESYGVAP